MADELVEGTYAARSVIAYTEKQRFRVRISMQMDRLGVNAYV